MEEKYIADGLIHNLDKDTAYMLTFDSPDKIKEKFELIVRTFFLEYARYVVKHTPEQIAELLSEYFMENSENVPGLELIFSPSINALHTESSLALKFPRLDVPE